MGNADTKLQFRKAVVQLISKTQVSFIYEYKISYISLILSSSMYL